MYSTSPTAELLAEAIEASGLTQREIADRVGFKSPNIISMLKKGETRVPLDRIPALAQTLGIDQAKFLLLAIEEYHSGIYEVLCEVLGLPLSEAERGVVVMFRLANLKGDLELEGPFLKALEGVLELAEMAHT